MEESLPYLYLQGLTRENYHDTAEAEQHKRKETTETS